LSREKKRAAPIELTEEEMERVIIFLQATQAKDSTSGGKSIGRTSRRSTCRRRRSMT